MGTYRFWQAASAAKNVTEKSVEQDMQAFACTLALNEYWEHYDWRESLTDLPPFWTAPGVQDYGPPFVAVPSDFMALKRAYFVDLQGGTNNVPWMDELSVVGDLPDTTAQEVPTSICYLPQKLSFRVHPRIPVYWGSPRYLINGYYKKKPTVYLTDNTTVNIITAGNIMNALLPTEDRYFKVWVQGLKWAYLDLAGDPRGQQQFAVFKMALEEMSNAEQLNVKKPPVAPKRSLVGGYAMGGVPYLY